MLLASPRHRRDDLDIWSELEAADLEHYAAAGVDGKAARAVELIGQFAAGGRCYASVSWGKDSTVLAHLMHRSRLGLPVGRVDQVGPGEDPHAADVRDSFLARWPLAYVEVKVDLDRLPDDGGHSPALDRGIALLQGQFGTRRYLGGVRAAEAGIRKIGMRSRGLATANTCQPIGWWSTEDVFAYLAWHRLPVHPSYAMLGGGRWDRRHIRVSILGGPKGNQFGRREWENEFYGDLVRRARLAQRRPSRLSR